MLRSVVSALARGGGSTCRSFAAVRSCPPTSPSSSGTPTGLSSLRGPTELSRDLASLHSSLIRAPPTIGHPPRPSVAPVSFCGLLSCWWSDPNITVAKPESTCVTEGLVAAWRLAPPATVQVVGGDSNPPPTPPSPLVHILTCPVPVAWQVNLPLHLLQVLFNASFYISHLLLAADRSRNRSRATAAAATCRRPRHRPCPASSRRAGTAARPAHPPRRAAAAGAIDAQACRAARGAVSAAVSLPRRRRRRRWTARMRARNGARSTGGYTINIIMYGRPGPRTSFE